MTDRIFRAALKRFENAVRAEEMVGARPPSEWNAVTDEYNHSRLALIRLVEGAPNDAR